MDIKTDIQRELKRIGAVTGKGLLQVDSLLTEFFEPQHRAVRYT
mgnify:CR=1 FL=1